VSSDGSIDWLCWPRFDSPSIFAALLDPQRGGFWQICPTEPFTSKREYVGNTNVLRTVFFTATGELILTDWMPVADEDAKRHRLRPDHQIERLIECRSGKVTFAIHFAPRPDFGSKASKLISRGALGLRLGAGRGLVALFCALPLELTEDRKSASAVATIEEGAKIACSLTYTEQGPAVLPRLEQAQEVLSESIAWWAAWSSRCTYRGPYREAVMRSVLALKLLQYVPSGAFVAALTTSLPERIGGTLNFDYRYCWLRDASLTIHALCGTGFSAEAEAFGEWLLHATRLTQPRLMVMYDLHGKVAASEKKLPNLSGYQGSVPVLVGNDARKQVQTDVYGEVVCGTSRLFSGPESMDRETSKTVLGFGKYVCKHWMKPDAGIWEPRDKPTMHTHSLLLSWVALDELIRMAERGVVQNVAVESFTETREQIRTHIEMHCWDENLQAYTSEPGSTTPDATLLLMAIHNFHPPDSPRLKGTYRWVQKTLSAGGGLLFRYRNSPSPEEGAFGICGFWAAEYLAMGGGTLEDAELRFSALLSYANDVGLFAEEIDPDSGVALGNFPQAFTHIGLITAALAIEKRRKEVTEIASTSIASPARMEH
jgi:GH15 family glucan-1,4-alpha-glucosidase